MCVCVWATLPDLNKMEWNGMVIDTYDIGKLVVTGWHLSFGTLIRTLTGKALASIHQSLIPNEHRPPLTASVYRFLYVLILHRDRKKTAP